MATQTEQRPDRTRRRRPRMAHALCPDCGFERFLCGKPRPPDGPVFRVPPSGFPYCVVCRDLIEYHNHFDS